VLHVRRRQLEAGLGVSGTVIDPGKDVTVEIDRHRAAEAL
jgi:hypothetical protein